MKKLLTMMTAFFLVSLLFLPSAVAATECVPTTDDCNVADTETHSFIQIGGPGSTSSNDGDCGGMDCDDPGKLEDGTIGEAELHYWFDRSAGTLSILLHNTTATTATLVSLIFNTPAAVTGLSLASADLCSNPADMSTCTGTPLLTWSSLFDPDNLTAPGFGKLDACVINEASPTNCSGGNPQELLAGEALKVVLNLTGDLSDVTACSFTAGGSEVDAGELVVTAVVKFQSGQQGGSGTISPCSGGPLLVELAYFDTEPSDNRVTVRFGTYSELDNAGFFVLRKPRHGGGPWERVNAALIPALGDTLSGADYSLVDEGVANGAEYRYRLEDLDLRGFNKLHPVQNTVPNPQNPPVKLQSPAYGVVTPAQEALELRWDTSMRKLSRVQFSADPSFPESARVVFPVRSWGGKTTMKLNSHELQLVQAVRGNGGPVYWRLVGQPGSKTADIVSDVFRIDEEE